MAKYQAKLLLKLRFRSFTDDFKDIPRSILGNKNITEVEFSSTTVTDMEPSILNQPEKHGFNRSGYTLISI